MDIETGGAAALLGDGGGAPPADPNAGTPPPTDPNASTPPADPAAPPPADLPEWAKGLSGDGGEADAPSNQDWVKSKSFKDLDGLVKAYRDTERALRDGGRVKVPGEGAGTEEVAAYHKAIGVPDDAKGYEVAMPETTGGLELNSALIGTLAEIAHKAGVPKAGFEALANAFVQQQVDDHLSSVAAQDAEASAKLKEWGGQKDAKLADCQAAMRGLGLDRVAVAQLQQAWGSGKALDFLAKIGGGIAEDTLITGGTGRFGISAAEAQKELDAIKSDKAKGAAVMIAGSPEQARYRSLLAVVTAERERQQKAA